MDRKTIEAFEQEYHYILPERYIDFLLLCDNRPEAWCESRDIFLCSLEQLPEERETLQMDQYCPEYLAIGWGGGGEVLVMKQERKTDTLIVTSGGNLISRFITPEYCRFFEDFFTGWASRGCPAGEINSMYL